MKVEAERAYHQIVLQILDQLEGEVSIHISWSCYHFLSMQKPDIPFDRYVIFFCYKHDFVLYVYLIIGDIRTTTN